MSRFFHAKKITNPKDVIPYLADPERHWKEGKSACELAHSWVNAAGIPGSVRDVLNTCPDYDGAVLVEGLFEHEVDLRTPGRASQTDLLAFVKLKVESDHGYAVIAVEGKENEPFCVPVSTWNDSPGKKFRLGRLCATLGLRVADVAEIKYQLLHRTASAIYEAQRYQTTRAVMLVHSFSVTNASFHHFQAFAEVMGIPVQAVNRVSGERVCEGIRLRLAWVADGKAAVR